jgi:DMSO reductase anchor subunit
MNPAWSVISFTTLAGAAQGLVTLLALLLLAGSPLPHSLLMVSLFLAALMLVAGLAASFLHLGHPERAWRAMAMWRTSWLSREVIVLPAFTAVVVMWWLWQPGGSVPLWLPALAVLLSAALWLCTAMIYACLRFVQEWAHPLTVATYTATGLASGALLALVMGLLIGMPSVALSLLPLAAVLLALAWALRGWSLRRNAALKPRSTLQSATGLHHQKLVQKSMGMSAGSFNTREFFHTASAAAMRHVRLALHGLCFGLPLALLMAVWAGAPVRLLLLALLLHVPGLLAERWLFFAQARHPQNLYYQAVS